MTAFTSKFDLINHILGITPDSAIALARRVRIDASEQTQVAYQQIFALDAESALTLPLKYFFAQETAKLAGNQALVSHYQSLLGHQAIAVDTAAVETALAYLYAISTKPNEANKSLIDALLAAGWSAAEVILLAQLITYVGYQARLLCGLSLLLQANQEITTTPAPVQASQWHQHPNTASGAKAPTAFTVAELDWEAWLPARKAATLSEAEAATMKKFGQINSEYFLLLAHQSALLHTRTLIDRGVFYTPEGLPRWERELAAVVASKVNGCIYCASVHARKAIQYAKDRSKSVHNLLQTPAKQVLADGDDERLNALIDFSASLSATPTQATIAQVHRLREAGLSELDLLDLVQASAFFAWANRLMLSLGEPALPLVAQEKE